MTVSILGGGAFGTALAIAIGQNCPVTLWARDARHLSERRESPRLPGRALPDALEVTDSLDRAFASGVILFSLPMQSLSPFVTSTPAELDGKALVACCKGLDLATLKGPCAILAERWPGSTTAILTGPSFATDIAAGLPTALTLACADEKQGEQLQTLLSTPSLRLYRSTDVTGAELGGALKNVIAIAAGFVIGAGLGDSARAALMTRGFAEMTRLAARMGARNETLMGLSGLGDLILTCTSEHSRNFRHGLALGRGDAPDPTQTVEGVATAQAILRHSAETGLAGKMPVTEMVARVTRGSIDTAEAIHSLMSRPLKEE